MRDHKVDESFTVDEIKSANEKLQAAAIQPDADGRYSFEQLGFPPVRPERLTEALGEPQFEIVPSGQIFEPGDVLTVRIQTNGEEQVIQIGEGARVLLTYRDPAAMHARRTAR